MGHFLTLIGEFTIGILMGLGLSVVIDWLRGR